MQATTIYAASIERHRQTISEYREACGDSMAFVSLSPSCRGFENSDAGQAGRSAFLICGKLLLSLPEQALPAALAESLREHRGSAEAAWGSALVWLSSASGSCVIVDAMPGGDYAVAGALAQSDAGLIMLKHLVCDSEAEATNPLIQTGGRGKPAADLYGDKLTALLTLAESNERQAASDTAYQQGRGAHAIDDADDAARELHYRTGADMVKWLILRGYVHESAAADQAFRKRVEHAMRKVLKWPPRPRRARPAAQAGAVAELAGKGQLGRQTAIGRTIRETEWCFNHKVTRAQAGEKFCETCMTRLSHADREAMLAGDVPCEGDKLDDEEIELHRQQSLEQQQEQRQPRRRFEPAGR